MSTPIKHNHLVVIGRIPDEDNQYWTYQNMTSDKAAKSFEKQLIADYIEDSGEMDREEKKDIRDQGVYIDFILTSESPIDVDSWL